MPVALGALGPGFHPCDASFGFAPEQFSDQAAADSIVKGSVGNRQTLVTDSEDDDSLFRHTSWSAAPGVTQR